MLRLLAVLRNVQGDSPNQHVRALASLSTHKMCARQCIHHLGNLQRHSQHSCKLLSSIIPRSMSSIPVPQPNSSSSAMTTTSSVPRMETDNSDVEITKSKDFDSSLHSTAFQMWTASVHGNHIPSGSKLDGSRVSPNSNDDARLSSERQQLLRALEFIPKKVEVIQTSHQVNQDIFGGSQPPEVPSHQALYLRQIQLEQSLLTQANSSFSTSLENMKKLGKGTSFKFIQRCLLDWYEPLCAHITAEVQLIKEDILGLQRKSYGPTLIQLPVDVIAVIVLDVVMNEILRCGNEEVTTVTLAQILGRAFETETNLFRLKRSEKNEAPWLHKILAEIIAKHGDRKQARRLNSRLLQLEARGGLDDAARLKIGSTLLSLLLESAKTADGHPAFTHDTIMRMGPKGPRSLGFIQLNSAIYAKFNDIEKVLSYPRFLPMLVKPRPWSRRNEFGPYYQLKTRLVRTDSKKHMESTRSADMEKVYEGLNYLGELSWRINKRILKIIEEAWTRGLTVGDLPNRKDVPYPAIEEFPLTEIRRKEIAALHEKYEKRIGRSKEPAKMTYDEYVFAQATRKIKMKNCELHSLRCDFEIKLRIARQFVDDEFYFPWNLDFRGRAYPIPPNLSVVGSDLSRGLLLFSEKKPLGETGLFWLKVHLANLFGNNKLSIDDRVLWVEKNMDNIRESVQSPLDGSLWWNTAEEPFQALSVCMEIVDAIDSGDPASFLSGVPVHQDGSCNGLQHYAALGCDYAGGAAVNLVPSESGAPQDVYSKVLEIVIRKIEEDSLIADDAEDSKRGKIARGLKGFVDRKVIKQTVMTSVYGVTFAGAREQVQGKIFDKLYEGIVMTDEKDKELFVAATYLANLTMRSLTEMFTSAREIMNWLGNCASLVSSQNQVMSWVTPLGLPVLQPYRKDKQQIVHTHLQSISLAMNSEKLPVQGRKQKTAFSPNFVHSLDSSHMLMTALKMKELKLQFTAVHDSYWTHPQNIPTMNKILRECFVELYEQPILDDLRNSLVKRYPEVTFPPIPVKGTLDIQQVKKSVYFFH